MLRAAHVAVLENQLNFILYTTLRHWRMAIASESYPGMETALE